MIPREYDGGQAVLVLNDGEMIPITDFNIEVDVDYTSVRPMEYEEMEFTFRVQFKEQ